MIWKTTLALFITLFSFGGVFGQFTADKPDLRECDFKCTSNNFTLKNVFLSLTDVYGEPISDVACEVGNVQEVYVLLNYTSNANSTINNTRLFADLSIDGIITPLNVFVGDVSGKITTTSQIKLFGPFEWTCGQELALENTLIVWRNGNGSEELSSYDCGTFNNAQCDLP